MVGGYLFIAIEGSALLTNVCFCLYVCLSVCLFANQAKREEKSRGSCLECQLAQMTIEMATATLLKEKAKSKPKLIN